MTLLKRLAKKAKVAIRKMKSAFDKCGSYTGTSDQAGGEKPEQDADDL